VEITFSPSIAFLPRVPSPMKRFAPHPLLATLVLLATGACSPPPPSPPQPMAALETEVRAIIRRHAGDSALVEVAFRDMATGDSLLVDAHQSLHAASTMKVPVMLELFRRADAGELSLDDPVAVRNEFRSIADGSTYALDAGDDSDSSLYRRLGERVPVRELVEHMITRSSNLATNLLIDLADPRRIARHHGIDRRGRDARAARGGRRPRLPRGDEQHDLGVRADAGDGGGGRRARRLVPPPAARWWTCWGGSTSRR
jgi:hypothetical protein